MEGSGSGIYGLRIPVFTVSLVLEVVNERASERVVEVAFHISFLQSA